MLRVLESTGLPVTTSDGTSTAYTRHQLGVAKSHVNDAACLDFPTQVQNLDIPVTVLRRQRRHSRQSINCNSHGSPASKAFPDYCRLPRSTQAYITPPSHSVGRRRINGIGTGDIVAHHAPLRSDLHRPRHCGHQSSASQNQTQGPPAGESLRHSVKNSSDRAPQPLDRILPTRRHASENPARDLATVSVSQRRVNPNPPMDTD